MSFQVSPGVNVSELDLTAGARAGSVSDAAFAGPFLWGPALEVRSIGSEDDLVKVFGKPDDTIYSYWFTAQSFLAYSSLLRVVRAITAQALNSTGSTKALASSVVGTAANSTWVGTSGGAFSTGFGTAPVLVNGQSILIGTTAYVVNAVTNSSAFSTTVAPPTLTLLGGVTAESGNVVWTPNATFLASSLSTLKVNAVVTISNGSVSTDYAIATVNSSTFTTNVVSTSAYTDSVVLVKSYVANTVSTYGTLIKNSTHYDVAYPSGASGFGAWAAKYPGELGNSLRVGVCPSANAFHSTPTGTLTLAASNAVAVGDGTLFLTELAIGDIVTVNGVNQTVASIANNSELTFTTVSAVTIGPVAHASWSRTWEYAYLFDRAPSTSSYATNRGGAADEAHVIVIDEDGVFSGAPGTILERYAFVSKSTDAKTPNGDNNYYVTAINRQSKYIWWLSAPGSNTAEWGTSCIGTTFGADLIPTDVQLQGGQTNQTAISDGDLEEAYDFFNSGDELDVSLIIAGPASASLISYLIQNIAEARTDCVVYASPSYACVVNNVGLEVASITAFRNNLPSSSFGFFDSGWKYQYDKYNDKYRWVPLNGDTAGIAARSDLSTDPWFSPAGFTRGNVKNVVKLAWNPRQLDRDDLYKIGVNPVVSFPAQGVVLYGDKTLLDRPSAFDRINVRRLFIILEKTIARLAQSQLFEFNDEFTRSQFRNIVEPYLRDVKARRGVTDYRVICDESNNTSEVVEQNRFVGDIFIKPSRSINFIQLNFVAVRNGVSFQEVTGVI